MASRFVLAMTPTLRSPRSLPERSITGLTHSLMGDLAATSSIAMAAPTPEDAASPRRMAALSSARSRSKPAGAAPTRPVVYGEGHRLERPGCVEHTLQVVERGLPRPAHLVVVDGLAGVTKECHAAPLGEAPDELQHQVSADPHEVLKLVDDDMAQLRDEGPVLSRWPG